MSTTKNNSVINEAQVSEFINNRSFDAITAETSQMSWDGAPLEEERIYHLSRMGGLKVYWIEPNRRTFRRALKMWKACTENGMTTPAILVDAQVVADWNIPMIDPATQTVVDKENLAGAYCVMEGHGRFHAYLLDLALASKEDGRVPFDYHFIYKHYESAEDFGKAYVSTNADMTRTTQKDRLTVAGARCQNPLVKENIRKIREDGVLAKASYFWTYGRELTKAEVTAITYETDDAPKFDEKVIDSLKLVYEAFKDKFGSSGAEKIYRGTSVAQWSAARLKDPVTAEAVAAEICSKVEAMDMRTTYTAILTAKTCQKKHITRDQVIKSELDKMMKG